VQASLQAAAKAAQRHRQQLERLDSETQEQVAARDEEREKVRQNVRQQHHTRKELSETLEDFASMTARSGELEKRCKQLEDRLEGLFGREGEHWDWLQAQLAQQRQSHGDLNLICQTLREEISTHMEYQRSESEKLRHHSTQRYLEQMDKALKLKTKPDVLELMQQHELLISCLEDVVNHDGNLDVTIQ